MEQFIHCLMFVTACLLYAGVANAFGYSDKVSGELMFPSSQCDESWVVDFLQKRKLKKAKAQSGGAGVCVFSAVNDAQQHVSVEIQQQSYDRLSSEYVKAFTAYKIQCGHSRLFRVRACKKAQWKEQIVEVSEGFLPVCLDVGDFSGHLFKVEQEAPAVSFVDLVSKVESHEFDVKKEKTQAKYLFAQLVAGIYAFHGVGFAHTELTYKDIATDATFSTLALVDFEHSAGLHDRKRADPASPASDENAIWMVASLLADCSGAVLPNAKRTVDCLRKNWGVDDDFAKALDALMEIATQTSKRDHEVENLFKSSFIQGILTKGKNWKAHYKWPEIDGCRSWSAGQHEEAVSDALYGYAYACDTIPTYTPEICQAKMYACFSLEADAEWYCHAGSPKESTCPGKKLPTSGWFQKKTYDGACFMPLHPLSKYANALLTTTATTTTTITNTKTTTITTTIKASTTTTTAKTIAATTTAAASIIAELSSTTTTLNRTNSTYPTDAGEWNTISLTVGLCFVVFACVALDIGSSVMLSRRRQTHDEESALTDIELT